MIPASLLFLILGMVSGENCFYNNHLTYIYSVPDYSGNYTSVKEYWLR